MTKDEINRYVQNRLDDLAAEGEYGYYETIFHVVHEILDIQTQLQADTPQGRCHVCSTPLALIRGAFPRLPQRRVCPTCVVERLEDLVRSLAQCEPAKTTPQETP